MTSVDCQVQVGAGLRAGNCAQPPLRLGSWELVAPISESELTRVYRARPAGGSPARPAAYALKVLRPEWEHHPQVVSLLAREAQVGRKVSHPHLVSVLSARVRDVPRYLVMPWLEGVTLADRLRDAAPPDLPEMLWVVRQVAEGLAALDAHGWMHGDVKPSNIMISPDGHATLIDLGFAHRRHEEASAVDRVVAGTHAYLAPEVLSSRVGADIRSDLYSLGVVLFEALTGRLPFSGQTLPELISQHQQVPPPHLKRLAPHVPDDVARWVGRLLAKDPLRRPQTAEELVAQLVRLEIATFSERAL